MTDETGAHGNHKHADSGVSEVEPDRRIAAFVTDLRRLREQAGQPSLRAMSATAHYSHTALSGVLSGGRLPSLELTLAFVQACGGDLDAWKKRWERENTLRSSTLSNMPGKHGPARRPRRWIRRIALVAAVATAAAIVAVTVWPGHGRSPAALTPGQQTSTLAGSPAGQPAPIPGQGGDNTAFVADIALPDGSTVHVNQVFVKTWEIQNTGTVTWENRSLQRIGVIDGFGLCSSPRSVPIPLTRPGERVQISVTMTAPSMPGSCRTDWKMVDATGRPVFPDKTRPLHRTQRHELIHAGLICAGRTMWGPSRG